MFTSPSGAPFAHEARNVSILEVSQATRLTKVQRLICKWFNIEPRILYTYECEVVFLDRGGIRDGHLLISNNYIMWVVTRAFNNVAIIKSVRPIDKTHDMGRIFSIFGHTAKDAQSAK